MKFYSPYQFINTKAVSSKLTEFEAIKAGESHIRHDRWQKNTLSGRIVCQMETITPIMVGGEHTEDPQKVESTRVENYRVPQNPQGRLAIPGNTLRGMVGSVIESISDSAMRVLADQRYSVRKNVKDKGGLHALGKVEKDQDGKYSIRPLALVTAQSNRNRIDFSNWGQVFKNTPLSECLAAYIGDYNNDSKVAGKALKKWRSFNIASPEYVYARRNKSLLTLDMSESIRLTEYKSSLHATSKGEPMLAGQQLWRGGNKDFISEAAFKQLADERKGEYQRGILYILGTEDREKKMPGTKKHDLFIPFDEQSLKDRVCISLPDTVIDDFNFMANQCAQSDPALPFVPHGHKKPVQLDNERVNYIEEGDIVYFGVGRNTSVATEISFSAMWRSSINRTTHDFFKQSAENNPNILPWGDAERDSLTPAECLLGVVESAKHTDSKSSRNLASRVSFYDAFSPQPIELLPETTLKILSSPKPPSPIMYFHNADGCSIKKSELDSDKVLPNGRKRYIHHPRAMEGGDTWKTADDRDLENLKIKCRPVKKGQIFYFHIDFNNLKQEELNLLLTAIEPALNSECADEEKNFMHKIGLGKPLGLGSVAVQIAGVFFIDREARYSSELIKQTTRYSHIQCGRSKVWSKQLAEHYITEHSALEAAENAEIPDAMDNSLINKKALKTLYNLGCVESLTKGRAVCYPFSSQKGQRPGEEGKGFQWFSDDPNNNNLGYADADRIPVLNSENNS